MNSSDNPRKDFATWVVFLLLIVITIFFDVYLSNNAGAVDPTWLASTWNSSAGDWIGIVLLHVCTIGLALGMMGLWEISTSSGKSLNWAWIILLLISIGLILIA